MSDYFLTGSDRDVFVYQPGGAGVTCHVGGDIFVDASFVAVFVYVDIEMRLIFDLKEFGQVIPVPNKQLFCSAIENNLDGDFDRCLCFY